MKFEKKPHPTIYYPPLSSLLTEEIKQHIYMARRQQVQGSSNLVLKQKLEGSIYWNVLHSQCDADIRQKPVTGVHGCYKLDDNILLGEGGEGQVKKGVNVNTQEKVAIKIISKGHVPDMNDNGRRCEIQILHIISHPNIISVIESIESEKFLYTIMELGNNDLMHNLENQIYGEDLARAVAKDLFCALDYLHKAGICHRDIKPENLIYCKSDNRESWKLADFGIAEFFTHDNPYIKGHIGTFEYMAPEMLANQNYTKAVDCWAAGVTLFSVLVYELPWTSEEHKEQQIMSGTINWGSTWNSVSKPSRDFVSQLLTMDPSHRLTANEALNHTWLSKKK